MKTTERIELTQEEIYFLKYALQTQRAQDRKECNALPVGDESTKLHEDVMFNDNLWSKLDNLLQR